MKEAHLTLLRGRAFLGQSQSLPACSPIVFFETGSQYSPGCLVILLPQPPKCCNHPTALFLNEKKEGRDMAALTFEEGDLP